MHFNLEITKNCNQKCFYCFNDSGLVNQKDELSIIEWKKIIYEIYSLGHKSIHITGGEPFLHPNIIEILTHAIELGIETTILSNGYKIACLSEMHPILFSKIKLAQISLDSMNKALHNKRRGFGDAYKDAIDAINALQKVGVPIEISAAVSDDNILDIMDLASFCYSINAALIIRPLVKGGRLEVFEHQNNFYEKLREIKNTISNKYGLCVIDDKFNYVINDNVSFFEHEKKGFLTIMANGFIRNSNSINENYCDFFNRLKVA